VKLSVRGRTCAYAAVVARALHFRRRGQFRSGGNNLRFPIGQFIFEFAAPGIDMIARDADPDYGSLTVRQRVLLTTAKLAVVFAHRQLAAGGPRMSHETPKT